MTRLLLVTLLFLSSVPAYAEWVKVGADDTFTTYADPDTIRSKGTTMKIWSLTDLQKARTTREGKSILSIKMLFEFDCAEEQIRILAEYAYAGQMGTSEIVYSYTKPDDWRPVLPGSMGHGSWKFACKNVGQNGPIF